MKVMYCYSVIVTHSVEAVIIKSVFFLVTNGHLLPPLVDITLDLSIYSIMMGMRSKHWQNITNIFSIAVLLSTCNCGPNYP